MHEDRVSSTSLLMSFSEMAWIVLLGVALLYSSQVTKVKKASAKQQNEINRLQDIVSASGGKLHVDADYFIKLRKRLEERDNKIALLEEKLENSDKLRKRLEEQDNSSENGNRIATLELEKKNTIDDLNKAKKEIQRLAAELNRSIGTDLSIRKELIGLKGNFERVVFIFDCSESMGKSGRWDYSCEIVKSWLQHLSFKECALITYNQNVMVFPASESQKKELKFLDMSSENRQEHLIRLTEHLNHIEPKGSTNTLKAFKKAFEYQPDTIMLFTDGAPTEITRTRALGMVKVKVTRKDILNLCKRHNDTPINIIGLGNYFDKRYGPFMLQIAEITGGAFIGR